MAGRRLVALCGRTGESLGGSQRRRSASAGPPWSSRELGSTAMYRAATTKVCVCVCMCVCVCVCVYARYSVFVGWHNCRPEARCMDQSRARNRAVSWALGSAQASRQPSPMPWLLRQVLRQPKRKLLRPSWLPEKQLPRTQAVWLNQVLAAKDGPAARPPQGKDQRHRGWPEKEQSGARCTRTSQGQFG